MFQLAHRSRILGIYIATKNGTANSNASAAAKHAQTKECRSRKSEKLMAFTSRFACQSSYSRHYYLQFVNMCSNSLTVKKKISLVESYNGYSKVFVATCSISLTSSTRKVNHLQGFLGILETTSFVS